MTKESQRPQPRLHNSFSSPLLARIFLIPTASAWVACPPLQRPRSCAAAETRTLHRRTACPACAPSPTFGQSGFSSTVFLASSRAGP